MTRSKLPSLVLCALLAAVAAMPAHADSSASSAASGSVSTSVGSLSASIRNSSESSSRGTGVAEGPYRIIDMAAVPAQPGSWQLTLQPLAADGAEGAFVLTLPQEAVERGRLSAGGVVDVRHRPYGLAFTAAGAAQAFFLVLDDGWHRELNTRVVRL